MKLARDKDKDSLKVVWDTFEGLDIQPDELSRSPNSWRRIENCDLFTPGSVRKVIGPQQIYVPQNSVINELFVIHRTPTDYMLCGTGVDGHLYNVTTGDDLGDMGITVQPFVGIMGGTTTGGLKIQYAIITTGAAPVKWERVLGKTTVGVSIPLAGVVLTKTQSATNLNAYLMQVGIQYEWTYFNPTTLHESSPSPVPTSAIITPTTNQPNPATPYITQIQIDIPTPPPALGDGYTRIRVYRTRDGGATFYLPPKLYNVGGANLSDAQGSILIQGLSTTVYDGVVATNVAPTPDFLLVNPPGGAPKIGANNPPPNAIWGCVYQSRFWYLDANGTRLWFSQIGDFQSVGVNNYFDFSQNIDDRVTAIVPLSDRMIVFGANSARQITGTDFSSFVEVPIAMRRGCVGFRAATTDDEIIYLLTNQSISRLSFAPSGPPFIGDKIKPLTDFINRASYKSTINMDIDTTNGVLAFAIKLGTQTTYNNQIILADLSRSESPFTTVVGFPTEIVTIREIELSDNSKALYVTGSDQNIYRLYSFGTFTGSLVATLETQKLPLDDLDIWKVFRSLTMFGQDIQNWDCAFSIDDQPFTPLQPVGLRSPCGLAGSQIVIQFVHSVNKNDTHPLLSRGILRYTSKMAQRA